MVTWLRRTAGLLGVAVALGGCSAPQVTQSRSVRFAPPPLGEAIYVLPFTTVMVPREIEQGVFDRLVDQLNRDLNAEGSGYEFTIIKRPLGEEGKTWLAEHPHLTGEIFGYIRDSGCCSTELRLRTRLLYYQPGVEGAALSLDYPRQVLFDHDKSNLELEQEKLIIETVQLLAERFEATLLNR